MPTVDYTNIVVGDDGSEFIADTRTEFQHAENDLTAIESDITDLQASELNASGSESITGAWTFSDIRIPSGTQTSSGTGTPGQMTYDGTYLYVCTATNTWNRIAWTTGGLW